MTDSKIPDETAGGPLGKLAGKVKEAAGSVFGNEQLAREGRLQQAQAEAEAEAARGRRRGTAAAGRDRGRGRKDGERARARAAADRTGRQGARGRDRPRRAASACGRPRSVPSRRRRPPKVSASFSSRPRRGPSSKRRPSGSPRNRRRFASSRKRVARKREPTRSTPRRQDELAHDFPISGRRLRQARCDCPWTRRSGCVRATGVTDTPQGRSPSTVSKHACGASPAGRCATKSWCETPSAGGWQRTSASGPARLRAEADRRTDTGRGAGSRKKSRKRSNSAVAPPQRAAQRKQRAEERRQAESRRIADVEARRRRANKNASGAKGGRRSRTARSACACSNSTVRPTRWRKKQDALTAKSEAERLRRAASRTKAARKRPGRA